MSSEELETASNGISRRTIAKGVAWATPAVAAVAAAPMAAASPVTTTTTRPPCVDDVSATGGTYPVTVSLSNCSTANSHWDFNFKITAATQNCDCTHLRVTFFDNPNRSRLWISNGFGSLPALSPGSDNPQSRTQHDPRLYVQKILTPGQTATFPTTGDAVRRVGGGAPHSGFEIDSGTAAVGTITAHGTADDSLHALINPAGGALPCSATGVMAYYRVDCGTSSNGPWTQLGGLGTIDECVPMIQSTVCRFEGNQASNSRYRLGISVANACGIPASDFIVTKIQRNNDTNFPNEGSPVWDGSQPLSAGVTNIYMPIVGNNGGQLWVSFTTDGGVNTSTIRVPTNNTACTGTCTLPGVPTTRSACRVPGTSGNATSLHRYTWSTVSGATSYDVRYSLSNDTNNNEWTTVFGVTSTWTTTVEGVRRLQVRAVNSCGNGAWSDTTAVSGSTTVCPTGFTTQTEEGANEASANDLGAETGSTPAEAVEPTTTESTESSTTGSTQSSTTETSDSSATPSEPTDQ